VTGMLRFDSKGNRQVSLRLVDAHADQFGPARARENEPRRPGLQTSNHALSPGASPARNGRDLTKGD
jgi:hypothetical protein